MDKEVIKNRIKVWEKCKDLGRCVCSTPYNPFPCPCPYFTKHKICKCNGEELKEGHIIKDWVLYNTNNKKG